MEISEEISKNLLDALSKSRKHLLRLTDNLTEEMWTTNPNGGRWSIQRAANHIVNSELFWIYVASGKSGPEPKYLQRDATLSDFHFKQQEAEELFKLVIQEEMEAHGFHYKKRADGKPSYHWALIRILEHAVYHTGMISLLRQQVGAPPLEDDEETWSPMVDSIFESIF